MFIQKSVMSLFRNLLDYKYTRKEFDENEVTMDLYISESDTF